MSAPNCKYQIDWKKVDELLIGGCSIVDIAAHFGCDRDTLYYRFEKEFGSALSAYSQEKKRKGDNLLRLHQYKKAMGLTEKGDNTLLIWLGKCRLKQKEHDESQDKEAITDTEIQNRLMKSEAIIEKYKEKFGIIDDLDIQDFSKTESQLS